MRDELPLLLDCSSGYMCDKMAQNYTHTFTNAKFLVFMYCNYVRWNHWRKLGDEYKGLFCIIIASSYGFIKFQNKGLKISITTCSYGYI